MISAAVEFHRRYGVIACCLSLCLNLTLLCLILKCTRREMLNCRMILLSSNLVDLLLTTANLLDMPMIFVDEGTLVLANFGLLTNIPQPYALICTAVYSFSLTAAYSTSTFQFLYRYNGLVRKKPMAPKIMIAIYCLMISSSAGICMFSASCLYFGGDAEGRGAEILTAKGYLVDGQPVVQSSMQAASFWGKVGIGTHIVYCSLCYSAIFYFAHRVRKAVRSAPAASRSMRSAQRQIDYVLIVQCAIPVLLVNCPEMLVCVMTLLGMETQKVGELMVRSISCVPILNAVTIILIVRSYRRAVLRRVAQLIVINQSIAKKLAYLTQRAQSNTAES